MPWNGSAKMGSLVRRDLERTSGERRGRAHPTDPVGQSALRNQHSALRGKSFMTGSNEILQVVLVD